VASEVPSAVATEYPKRNHRPANVLVGGPVLSPNGATQPTHRHMATDSAHGSEKENQMDRKVALQILTALTGRVHVAMYPESYCWHASLILMEIIRAADTGMTINLRKCRVFKNGKLICEEHYVVEVGTTICDPTAWQFNGKIQGGSSQPLGFDLNYVVCEDGFDREFYNFTYTKSTEDADENADDGGDADEYDDTDEFPDYSASDLTDVMAQEDLDALKKACSDAAAYIKSAQTAVAGK